MPSASKLILGSGVSFSKSPAIAEEVISMVVQCGITKIDTAPSYKTEELVGIILKKQFEKGIISRSNRYIQTLCWRFFLQEEVQHEGIITRWDRSNGYPVAKAPHQSGA